TKRAARADPEAALLGAAEGAPRAPRRPPCRPVRARRSAARGAWPAADPLPPAAKQASVAPGAMTRPFLANAATVIARARVRSGPKARPGARPVRRGRALCAAEKRSSAGGAR